MWCKIKDTIEPIINDWNFKIILIYLAVIILLIFVAHKTYTSYILPKINPDFVANKEFETKTKKDNHAEIYLFCVKWCPHCKKAKPVWNEVKKRFNNKEINGIKIFFKEVDCEDNSELAEEYKVESYPTIKLVKDDEVIEYNAKPEKEVLEEFLHSVL